MHAVRRHSELATSINTENAQHTERPQDDMALEQRSVVAKIEVVCATDLDHQSSVRRQPIINRLDVGLHLTSLRVGRVVVGEEKHEGLVETCLNDAAKWTTIHVNPRLAPGLLRAELCGLRSTKGVTEYPHPRHVEPPCELAGWVRSV